jgi:hypothetical protein
MTWFGDLWEMLWRKQYLSQLRRELSALFPGTEERLLRLVEIRASETYAVRRGEAPDPQGLMVISTCCLILASYRELVEHGVAEERAFEAVRRSFSRIFANPARTSVRVMLFFMPDPVGTMRRRSIAPFFRAVFGRLFTFEELRTSDGFVLVIPRCGVHEFFKSEGEPRLTRVFCAWDRNWLGALDRADRPVATRRTLTLVTDGTPCEFHFESAERGPAPTVDVSL